jgi:hypothetical protein
MPGASMPAHPNHARSSLIIQSARDRFLFKSVRSAAHSARCRAGARPPDPAVVRPGRIGVDYIDATVVGPIDIGFHRRAARRYPLYAAIEAAGSAEASSHMRIETVVACNMMSEPRFTAARSLCHSTA